MSLAASALPKTMRSRRFNLSLAAARELWKILEPQRANAANIGWTNVRVLSREEI